MGHCIDAIIAQKPVNENKAKELGFAMIYESEFVIIPLIEENIYHFTIENRIKLEYFGEDIRWDCTAVQIIAKKLGFVKYVIATLSNPDFLGSYYEEEVKVKHEIDINSALNQLGVPKDNDSEFSYLNLDSYRNAEFYYMKEIAGLKQVTNIIKGTILYPDYSKEN